MEINLDPGFDTDFDLAHRAEERGWLTRAAIEKAILEHEKTPGSRLLNLLPLAPEQRDRLLAREPAAIPPEVAEAADDPGRRVDHYVLGDFLQSGGMGRVHKAWDLRLSRWVALKFLKAVGDARSEAWFEREARLAAGLTHPNIAAIYGTGQAAGERYIAMQYIEGETLEKGGREDIPRLVAFVRDAARAVAHANARGIVHRDLKPANVMVTPDGRVFVLDFGLARPVEAAGRHSGTGKAVGTPAYMSPEQARGDPVDGRSDVYSLGATLYECLTGRPPFGGSSVYEILRQVEETSPRRLRPINPRVARDLETIVLKCLEKDPSRRYGGADELADDLDRFLNRDAIRARPSGMLYRLRRRIAKRKSLTAALIATAVLAGAVLWWMVIGRPGSEHLRLREAATKLWAEARGAAMAGGDREGIVRRAKEAREAYERANRVHEEAPAHVMRARCLHLEGRDDEAVQALERALALDSGNLEARIDLAKAILTRYRKSRGFPVDFTVVVEKSADVTLGVEDLPPETQGQRVLRERGEKLLAAGGATPAQEGLLNGLLALGRGDHPRAVAEFERYTRAEAWDAQAHWLEATCRYYARDFAGAQAALDRSIDRVPDPVAFRWRAMAKEARGLYAEAIADCAAALALNPAYADAYFSQGLCRSSLGLHDEAIVDYSKVLELNPRSAVAANNRGNAKCFKMQFREAVDDFTKAIELDPRFAGAYNNRGNAKLSLGRPDEADEDFRKALHLDPGHGEAWYNLGRALSARRMRDEAIAAYTKALELDPRNAKALTNRGLAKSEKGLKDEAIADFTRAIEFDPRLPEAWSCRAFAKLHKGMAAEAAEDWKRSLEVAPARWQHRAEIQGRLENLEATLLSQEAGKLHASKRYAEAIALFRKVMDAHPKSRISISCAYNIACGHALLGDRVQALDWLEKAVDMGWTDASHLEKDADLASLRDEERYRKIVARLNGE